MEESASLFKRGLPFPKNYERFPARVPNPLNNNSSELSLTTCMSFENLEHAKRARRVKRKSRVREGRRRELSEEGLPSPERMARSSSDGFLHASGRFPPGTGQPGRNVLASSVRLDFIGAENRKLIEELKQAKLALRAVQQVEKSGDLDTAQGMLADVRGTFDSVLQRRAHLRAEHPVAMEPLEMAATEVHPYARKYRVSHQDAVKFGMATNATRIQSEYREHVGSGAQPVPLEHTLQPLGKTGHQHRTGGQKSALGTEYRANFRSKPGVAVGVPGQGVGSATGKGAVG